MTDNKDKPKPPTPMQEMLTPEEIEDLRRDAKETHDLGQKAFAHLRTQPDKPAR